MKFCWTLATDTDGGITPGGKLDEVPLKIWDRSGGGQGSVRECGCVMDLLSEVDCLCCGYELTCSLTGAEHCSDKQIIGCRWRARAEASRPLKRVLFHYHHESYLFRFVSHMD